MAIIVAEFESDENTFVQVIDQCNGFFNVIEVTGDVEKLVQPSLDAIAVVRYLSHRLHNMHFLYNKLKNQ